MRLARIAIIVLLFAPQAIAEGRPSSADRRASEAATRAVKLYRQGKHKEAAELFLDAYNISKRRAQLRNAAKAYEEGGFLDESLDLWMRYKDHEGSTTDEKAEADAHVQLIGEKKKNAEAVKAAEAAKEAAQAARIEAEQAKARAEEANKAAVRPPEAARASTPIPPPSKEEPAPVAGYLFIGGGAALLIGGGALWLLAQGRLSRLDDKLAMKNAAGQITGISPDDADSEVSVINTMRIGAGALAGAGILAIGVGVAWLLSSGPDERSAVRIHPTPGGLLVRF
jgi:hypothetical protein